MVIEIYSFCSEHSLIRCHRGVLPDARLSNSFTGREPRFPICPRWLYDSGPPSERESEAFVPYRFMLCSYLSYRAIIAIEPTSVRLLGNARFSWRLLRFAFFMPSIRSKPVCQAVIIAPLRLPLRTTVVFGRMTVPEITCDKCSFLHRYRYLANSCLWVPVASC